MLPIKNRLETVRAQMGVQWQELASVLGVSRQMLTLVKKGSRCFGSAPMRKLKELESKLNIVYYENNKATDAVVNEELREYRTDEVAMLRDQLKQAYLRERDLVEIIKNLSKNGGGK